MARTLSFSPERTLPVRREDGKYVLATLVAGVLYGHFHTFPTAAAAFAFSDRVNASGEGLDPYCWEKLTNVEDDILTILHDYFSGRMEIR